MSISRLQSNKNTYSSVSKASPKASNHSSASKASPKASSHSSVSKGSTKVSEHSPVSKGSTKASSHSSASKVSSKVSSSSYATNTSIQVQSNKSAIKAAPHKSSIKTSSVTDNKTSVVVKGVGVSTQNNPIRDTNFFIKTNTSEATKVNILRKGNNGIKPQWVARIDGAHKSPPKPMYPHINTNGKLYPNNKIYQSLNHKPISNVTYAVAKNYDKLAKYAKVGGRALTAIAVVSDVKDVYNSFRSDGNTIGRNTMETTAGVAGGWVGGVGGAKAGAMGGAAIGTMICPGLGTLVGGTIGGIIGGIFGTLLGKEGGKAIVKQINK